MDIKFMWEYGKVLGIQLKNFSSRNMVISTLITLCTQTHTHNCSNTFAMLASTHRKPPLVRLAGQLPCCIQSFKCPKHQLLKAHFFSLRSHQTSQCARSGEYSGCGMRVICFSIKNCCTDIAMWLGTLSHCRIHFSGCFASHFVLQMWQHLNIVTSIHNISSWHKFTMDNGFTIESEWLSNSNLQSKTSSDKDTIWWVILMTVIDFQGHKWTANFHLP
jgi:hypothetical protein